MQIHDSKHEIMTSAHLDGQRSVLEPRQAAQNGIVLELTIKGDGFYDVFYTLDVNMGTPPILYPLLVDTGSSDLWIAAPSCGCASNTPTYDSSSSSSSTSLPHSLSAQYLFGSFSGPLYTDSLSIGPYTLPHQAFCGATHVENEGMGLGFSGLIGLGLAGMSEIQETLADTSSGGPGNANGGAAPVALNLFDASVVANTPSARWFSLVLDRPGFNESPNNASTNANNSTATTTSAWSNNWPARLGIGQHVEEVVHAFSTVNPGTPGDAVAALESALQYLPLVTSPGRGTGSDGYTHWKTRFSGVTIYTTSGDGNNTVVTPQDVRLSRGVDGGPFPVAVLDSGGPNVLASRAVADAIYGALGVQMAADGNYYVPCKTPINITITLASSPPIPIHPLDMSTYIHNDRTTNPTDCLGTIQVSNMLGASGSPADIALGISFLRNVYVVHQMDTPSGTGTGAAAAPTPRLGIAPLTNPTLALTEFQNVRIKNLSPSGAGASTPPMSGGEESLSMLSKISIGLGVFLSACVLLFAVRWIVLRRRFKELRRRGMASGAVSMDGHASGVRRGGTLGRRNGGGTGRWTMDGVDDFVEMVRRKTTLRAKKRRKEKVGLGGGWKEVSEVGHEEGLSGAVATRSAIGHGSGGGSSGLGHARPISPEAAAAYPGPFSPVAPSGLAGNGPDTRNQERVEYGLRPEPEREGSGPFAGFSLWTFVGAKRLLGPRTSRRGNGGGAEYERTANPGLPGESTAEDGPLTEGQLRQQKPQAHQRRQQRENEASIWSDVTWVECADGTLVPAGTAAAGGKHLRHNTDEFGERKGYGYPATPNDAVVGSSTTNLVGKGKNEYGLPKELKGGDSDDGGSTVHGSLDFGNGKGRAVDRRTHSRSRSASKEAIPLLDMSTGMASTSSFGAAPIPIPASHSRSGSGGQGTGRPTHRNVPSLELHHPPRLDSSGIITASPYPMTATPGEGSSPFGPFGTPPRTSGTPPRMSGTPPHVSGTPPQTPSALPDIAAQFGSEGFNPYEIPTTVHAPPPQQPTLVHPARQRVALVAQPNLSPLTEVNSAEFPPSTNRMSIMSVVVPPAGAVPDWNADGRRSEEDTPQRQSSIGALSVESEVLVPLPISLMKLSHSNSPPPITQPLTFIQSGAQYNLPAANPNSQQPTDWGLPQPAKSLVPPPPPPKVDTSRTLPAQKAGPMAHSLATPNTLPPQPSSDPFHPPTVSVAAPPQTRQPAGTPPASNQIRSNNPFDLLALNDFGSRDSQFPPRGALGLRAQDSRFPTFAPTSSSAAIPRPLISVNMRSSSAEPSRPTSVTVPQEAARPRIRTRVTDMEQARPQSEAINFGGAGGGPVSRNDRDEMTIGEQPWMKLRSYSHGNASLPAMNRSAESRAPVQPPAEPHGMHDFAPPHEYRPVRPEQRTLPITGTQERSSPPSRVSEPASASMGMRSRGPRPMVSGPRSANSTGSGSTHSPPTSPPSAGTQQSALQSRQGTNYDSPASLPSASPLNGTSSTFSLPRGARAPSDPRPHQRLPSIPRNLSSPPIPISPSSTPPASHPGSPPASLPLGAAPPIREQNPTYRMAPSRRSTLENDPNVAYSGMAGDGDTTGWREEAARTAGVAGVGARSRFTKPMDPYPSPFDDRV